MKIYNNFIGIDIGKKNFVVYIWGEKFPKEYENNAAGIALFIKEREGILASSLCVLETTGGYEMELLLTLCEQQMAVHRANTRNVKSFIRSWGNAAKTDALDAKALARYGHERHNILKLFSPVSDRMHTTGQLKKLKQLSIYIFCVVYAPQRQC